MSDLTADSGKLQLMAEIERLTHDFNIILADNAKAKAEIERLRDMQIFDRQELARLVAEIERLRAALREIADMQAPNWNAMLDIARAALEGKP